MKTNFLSIIFFFFAINNHYSQEEFAWVNFSDKKNVEFLISNPNLILSDLAILKKQSKGITIDFKDVPINKSYIDSINNISGLSVLAKSKWFNNIYVKGDLEIINSLISISFVNHIEYTNKSLNSNKILKKRDINPSKINSIQYGSAINQVEMLNLNTLHDQGFTGKGVNIAVIDAGFKNVNSMISFNRLRDSLNIKFTYDFVLDTEDIYSYEGNSHGTKVLSTIAGFQQDLYYGTAPDASFYLFRTEDVLSETPVEENYWVEAVETADSLGVDIINTSLGYKVYDNTNYSHTSEDLDGYTTFITRAANIAYDKGILLVNSAGNSSSSGIIAPADSPGVFSIGAVDYQGNYASFSSQGSDIQPIIKPDVVAQGLSSSVINTNDNIVTNSGTSFSSPIIAGALACLVQALPRLNNKAIMDIVRQSSSNYSNPDYYIGHGIPDFSLAYDLGLESTLTSFIVYPNPFINNIHIISSWEITSFDIDLFNIKGKLLNTKKNISTYRTSISSNFLKQGVYILRISYVDNSGIKKYLTKKLIKK